MHLKKHETIFIRNEMSIDDMGWNKQIIVKLQLDWMDKMNGFRKLMKKLLVSCKLESKMDLLFEALQNLLKL